MDNFVVTSSGIQIPTYEEIYTSLKTKMKDIFGQDIYLEPDSPDGQFLSVIAMSQYDLCQRVLSVYNNFYPHTAQGVNLDRVCGFQGIQRKIPTKSVCTVSLKGIAGTVINNGVVVDLNNNLWVLPPVVTISVTSEALVTATSVDFAVVVGPHEIINILNPVNGWESVDNEVACTRGNALETDIALRKRRKESILIPTIGMTEGLQGALQLLTGVTKCIVIDNPLNMPSLQGLPAHSVTCVVQGGLQQEVAQTIFYKKSLGVYTNGDIVTNILDRANVYVPIRFYAPKLTTVKLQITLQKFDYFAHETYDTMVNNINAYIDDLPIGAPVYYSKILNALYNSEVDKERTTFNVSVIDMLKQEGEEWQGYQNIVPMLFNELAVAEVVFV